MNITPRFSRTLALFAPAAALSVSTATAASDYFLKIEGIKGESTKDWKHKDEIDVMSFSWGCSNAGARQGGTAKPTECVVTKQIDKSSPQLMLACATGQPIPSVTFTVSRSDGTGGTTDYYVVTLSDVLISSFQSSATSGGDRPTESVSFNFTKIEMSYVPADSSGTVSVSHTFSSSTPAGTP